MSSVTSTTGTSLALQYKDTAGVLHNIPFPLQVQNFRNNRFPEPSTFPYTKWMLFGDRFGARGSAAGYLGGYGNDGTGVTYLDTLVPFGGSPTARAVAAANAANSGTTPGSIPAPGFGNITKRRIQVITRGGNGASRIYFSAWIFPSGIGSPNGAPILHIYNRDGTNRFGGALWMDFATPALRIIESGNVWNNVLAYDWTTAVTFDGGWSTTTGTGQGGMAGNWHYLEFGIDFGTSKYLYAIINDQFIDLSTHTLYSNADTSSKALHFSIELQSINGSNSNRWMHTADPEGGMVL